MAEERHAGKLLKLAKKKGILRARELDDHDIPRVYLSRLTKEGKLIRIGRGLYQHAEHEVTAWHSLAQHGLTTQNPPRVWVAIGPKDHEPEMEGLSLKVVRMSGEARREGAKTHRIEKVPVPIFSPAKTVADCFKYRSRVGLDVAIEALRDFHRQRAGSMDELWHYAGICRVQSVIRPYMEAIVAW